MNLSLFLTLVVSCGVSVVYSQAVDTKWGHCPNLTHQHNVDLDQVSGIWYFQGVIVPSTVEWSQGILVCSAFRLTRTSPGLLIQAWSPRPGLPAKIDEWLYEIADPATDSGVWIHTSESLGTDRSTRMTVLDQSSDNTTLALATCSPNSSPDLPEVVVVLSRDWNIETTDLNAVNDRLQHTLTDTVFVRNENTTVCQEVDPLVWPIVYKDDMKYSLT